MEEFLALLRDITGVAGRLVSTAAILAVALVVAAAAGRLAARRYEDSYGRYYARKIAPLRCRRADLGRPGRAVAPIRGGSG